MLTNRFSIILAKLVCVFLLFYAIGFPFNQLEWFLIIIFAIVYIIYATLKINDIKEVYFTSLILFLLFLVKFQFPLGTIYEQHNIYLPPDGDKFPTYKSLPASVNSFFEKEFLSIYPKDKWQTNEYGTWRGIGRDKHVEISKSADGLYDRKYLKKK